MITRDSYGRVNRTIRDISKMKIWEHIVYVQLRYSKPDTLEIISNALEVVLKVVSFILAIIVMPIVMPIIAHREIKRAKVVVDEEGRGL